MAVNAIGDLAATSGLELACSSTGIAEARDSEAL